MSAIDLCGKASEWDGPVKYGLLWAGYSYQMQQEQPDYPDGFEFAANYSRAMKARKAEQPNDPAMNEGAGPSKRSKNV